jgi:hypothetical protein
MIPSENIQDTKDQHFNSPWRNTVRWYKIRQPRMWFVTFFSFFSYVIVVLGIHWHLQKFLQYIIVEFTPPSFSFIPLLLTGPINLKTKQSQKTWVFFQLCESMIFLIECLRATKKVRERSLKMAIKTKGKRMFSSHKQNFVCWVHGPRFSRTTKAVRSLEPMNWEERSPAFEVRVPGLPQTGRKQWYWGHPDRKCRVQGSC